MTTLRIDKYQMPITENLEVAFALYQAYMNLPSKVKYITDPDAHEWQHWSSELDDVLQSDWLEFIDQNVVDDTTSEDEYISLQDLVMDHKDTVLEQLATITAKEPAQ